jgi:hypothetical protein
MSKNLFNLFSFLLKCHMTLISSRNIQFADVDGKKRLSSRDIQFADVDGRNKFSSLDKNSVLRVKPVSMPFQEKYMGFIHSLNPSLVLAQIKICI